MEGMTKRKWRKIRRSVAFSAEDIKWLDREAEARNISVSVLVRTLVEWARYCMDAYKEDRVPDRYEKMTLELIKRIGSE